MKKIILFTLLIFIGLMLAAGFQSGKFQFDMNGTSAANPDGSRTPASTPVSSPTTVSQEHLVVSIGNYNAVLPVFINNITAGNVSPGTPLDIRINEGHYAVKVCDGMVCVQADVQVTSGIKTVIDFGERLARDVPNGSLNVSIGNYLASDVPVFIDDHTVGQVSFGKPLNITVSQGRHTVKVCLGIVCENESVDIQSANLSSVDFGERLARDVPKGGLIVSIGGYNAAGLPVFIDNLTAGEVSFDKPLNMMVSEGNHTVRVCAGMVCENASVEVKFAQLSSVDFGEQLKKDAEFLEPTVRIVGSLLSGNTYSVDVEFINPDITDHTMTAVIGISYSYIDNIKEPRKNDFATKTVNQFVKAGGRQTQKVFLYLTKGSYPLASAPTVGDLTIK